MTVSLSLHANQAWLTRYTHLQQPYEAVHQRDRTYFIVCVWYYDMHTTHKWDVTNTLCMLSTTWLSLCTHIYNTPFRYACGTRIAHYSWTSCDLHSLRCMNVNRLSLVIREVHIQWLTWDFQRFPRGYNQRYIHDKHTLSLHCESSRSTFWLVGCSGPGSASGSASTSRTASRSTTWPSGLCDNWFFL